MGLHCTASFTVYWEAFHAEDVPGLCPVFVVQRPGVVGSNAKDSPGT